MKTPRRKFLKSVVIGGSAAAFSNFFTALAASNWMTKPQSLKNNIGSPPIFPWQREISLREAAKSGFVESTLHATDPQPNVDAWPRGQSMQISNLQIRSTIWGPPERVTISMIKNNVWDRRINPAYVPTLSEITEGAFSPANKNFKGVEANTSRPKNLGYLLKEGGAYDPFRHPVRYDFPCQKPVGQIIIGSDEFKDSESPKVTQSCKNGIVRLNMEKGEAKASLEYVLGMKSNIYAIRGNFTGLKSTAFLRLYRHRDTSHQRYMTPDGKKYTIPETEKGAVWNGPVDPPQSGSDGHFFWIRQRLPAEKTFPKGFEYVLMGVVTSSSGVKLDTADNLTGLGTTPPTKAIAEAEGSAATATLAMERSGSILAFVAVVTSMDANDIIVEAKKRLTKSEKEGFEAISSENEEWFGNLYDQRENGRVFYGQSESAATDDIRTIYRSWYCNHGGGTKTNMEKLESSAHYGVPEIDNQNWHSSPCYNEVLYTPHFVRNRADSVDMWKQIIKHWKPGAEEHARSIFNLPGMYITHGYLPPTLSDKYVHSAIALEYCFATMAQIFKPVWDEWDYGADEKYLREECYPLMKKMAIFYAAYAKQGEDGYYHVIPSMQEECWGFYPGFARNKDTISSLCMFRWALLKTADASEILDIDAGLRIRWREIANKMAPYPTWEKNGHTVFAGIPGVEPNRYPGDHPWDVGAYPTVLADEINLDSSPELKERMVNTVRELPSASTNEALVLLGTEPGIQGSGSGFETSGKNNAPGQQVNANPERLMNSRSGRIYLFPCVPGDTEVAFRKFQARGGFLISAVKTASGVNFLEIEARRKTMCKLMNPWPGSLVSVQETTKNETITSEIDKSNGECIIFNTIAGYNYRVEKVGG